MNKKILLLLCTLLLCMYSCRDDDKSFLKTHEVSVGTEGKSLKIYGKEKFCLEEIVEFIGDDTIYPELDLYGLYDYQGSWYRISIDKDKKEMLINISENTSGKEKKLAILVCMPNSNISDGIFVKQVN